MTLFRLLIFMECVVTVRLKFSLVKGILYNNVMCIYIYVCSKYANFLVHYKL